MKMHLTNLLTRMSNIKDVSVDEFMSIFDYDDYVDSLNGGEIDVYQIGNCVGIVELVDNNTICIIGKLESELL